MQLNMTTNATSTSQIDKALNRKLLLHLLWLPHQIATPTLLTLHLLITNGMLWMMFPLTVQTSLMMMHLTRRLRICLTTCLTIGLPALQFPMAHMHTHPLSIQPLLSPPVNILPLLTMFPLSILVLTLWTYPMMRINPLLFNLKIFTLLWT